MHLGLIVDLSYITKSSKYKSEIVVYFVTTSVPLNSTPILMPRVSI